MWIKICGMTTASAVSAALAARVDAIGFVFAESVRRVTPELAAKLAVPARGRVPCIAVIRKLGQHELDLMLATFAPDVLQADAGELSGMRLPRQLSILPVVRANAKPREPLPARILFEGPVSGTGVPCDWHLARELAGRTELILAGGLTARNVQAAIAAVHPFGVDVSSGVEERPGIKSPQEIERFVAACRGEDRT